MTTNIKLKSTLIQTIFMIGISIFALACGEKKNTESEEIGKPENIENIKNTNPNDTVIVIDENDNDSLFLLKVAEMQLEEISLGQLAQQKGNSVHVKVLGKMMEKDHTKILAELKNMALARSVTIPISMTEYSQEVYQELSERTGNDFGRSYSDLMVDHHKEAIELFEKRSISSDDAEIRTWTESKLARLKMHLKHAEACKIECDKM